MRDALGLDDDPDTRHELYQDKGGHLARPHGVFETARSYYERYGKPLLIADSSIGGDNAERQRWLEDARAKFAASAPQAFPSSGALGGRFLIISTGTRC